MGTLSGKIGVDKGSPWLNCSGSENFPNHPWASVSSLHCPSLVRIPLCWFSQKSPTRRFPFINFISPMTPCSFAKSPLAYPVFEAELSYGVLCCSLRAVVLSKMPLLLRLPSSSGFLCYGAAQKRHRSVHIYTHASTTVHIHRCTKTHMDTAHMQHAHTF